jgi:hypothetical protein
MLPLVVVMVVVEVKTMITGRRRCRPRRSTGAFPLLLLERSEGIQI